MRDRVDELLRVLHHAVGDGVGPELLGMIELLEDFDGLGNVYRAIGLAVRGVAQFADAGMTGARVVPAVGAFLGEFFRDLIDLDGKAGLQALQHGTEIRGHDTAANQDHLGIFNMGRVRHG